MGLEFEYEKGQTPLNEEEKEGLKILSVTTKAELDEFEQKNIEQAILWTIGRKLKIEEILSESFIKRVHKEMFGEVWRWAETFRKSEKNLGLECWKISTALRTLLDDTRYWIDNNTMLPEEIAITFKHRIVCIHCFPNGNGRHSRLMADIIIEKIFGRQVFSWGQSASHLSSEGKVRSEYLKALKLADKGDLTKLMEFADS